MEIRRLKRALVLCVEIIIPFFLARLDILGRLSEKQADDLLDLNDEKAVLQETMGMLAEKYEDTKDRQELILKRYCVVNKFGTSCSSYNSQDCSWVFICVHLCSFLRIENVLEFIQSRQPVLSHAETRMKQELQEMTQNLKTFRKSFEQVIKYTVMHFLYNFVPKG